jgi:TRAP-type C4-dicarboxylate transport system permease small subunit
MSSIGAIFLCLMMFWVVADVVLRALFNRPILGSFEIVEYGMVFFVFMALSFAQFNKAHIRVPVLVERLGPRGLAAMDAVTGLVAVAIIAAMAWGAFNQTGRMFDQRITSQVLLIPKWPFQLVTFLGLCAFVIAKLADVLECLARAIGNPSASAAGEGPEELRVL